jgi:superfamily I DNA and/or RNA helicase
VARPHATPSRSPAARSCHPALAAIANAAFYGGSLLDGCSAAQRGPLLPGLQPLVFCDVRGREEAAAGSRSAANRAEAAAVVQARRPAGA